MVGWLVKAIHAAYSEVAKLTSVDIKLDRKTRAASSAARSNIADPASPA
jgi:hypothetical protein